MVIDNIKNAGLYYGLGKGIESALEYIQKTDFSKVEPGKYEIDGSNLFILLQKYETSPLENGKYEAHKKYIDIQYIVEGTELIGYANTNNLSVSKDYDSEKDFMLLEGKGYYQGFEKGMFAILWPEDAHMPSVTADKSNKVVKVVAKIRI